MAFLDSFADTNFGEVLSGLEDISARAAEGFARDPAVRAEQKIARIRKQEREADKVDRRTKATVERLRLIGKLGSGIISEGNPAPQGFLILSKA